MFSKHDLRGEVKKRISLLTEAEKNEHSHSLCQRIIKSEEYNQSLNLWGYYPFNGEINILPLLQRAINQGKQVLLPRVEGDKMSFYPVSQLTRDLLKNKWGIFEPIPQKKPASPENASSSLMLLPGLAFSPEGKRLGRGGGYYDRFLCENRSIYLAGTAYPFQIYPDIPTNEQDIILNKIFY